MKLDETDQMREQPPGRAYERIAGREDPAIGAHSGHACHSGSSSSGPDVGGLRYSFLTALIAALGSPVIMVRNSPVETSVAIRSSRSCARRSSEYNSIRVIAASIAFVLRGSLGMNSTRAILLTQESQLWQVRCAETLAVRIATWLRDEEAIASVAAWMRGLT
jgi:hypothetical protein